VVAIRIIILFLLPFGMRLMSEIGRFWDAGSSSAHP
jgi:hypothetical protein